jgi:hypothetical protein
MLQTWLLNVEGSKLFSVDMRARIPGVVLAGAAWGPLLCGLVWT